MTIPRPALSPLYRAEILEEDRTVLLLSERRPWELRGEIFCRLIPMLDGRHTVDQLAEQLDGAAGPLELYHALALLEQHGLLVEGPRPLPAREAALWAALGADPAACAEQLSEATVALATFGAIDREVCRTALAAAGLGVRDAETGPRGAAGLTVAVTDDYLHDGLAAINASMLRDGTPWLLVRAAGTALWIGPLFRPGSTACWACLADRLAQNRPAERFLRERGRTGGLPASSAALAVTAGLALQMAAFEAARWLVSGRSPLEGAMITLDLATLGTRRHVLVRLPNCPRCGDAHRRAGETAPVVLVSRPKAVRGDGGYRTLRPEDVLERYGHHVSPITGIVTELRAVSAGATGTHTYRALSASIAMMMKSTTGVASLRLAEAGGFGNGLTAVQARAAALCETFELYSGSFQGDEPCVRNSYRRLGDAAVHPNACTLYSVEQYRTREAWNRRKTPRNWIPVPFDEDREIEWTALWSLTKQTWRHLPTAYLYFGHPDAAAEPAYCWPDSNGNAAGSTREEAVLHALLELIERDSVAIWWYNFLHRPEVDLTSFDDPAILGLRDGARDAGRDLWVLDLTTDTGIPAFAAVSAWSDGRPGTPVMGFGAHLDPRIGVLRAIEEHMQLGTVLDGDAAGHASALLGRPPDASGLPHLRPAPDARPVTAADYAPAASAARDDIRDDVLALQATLERLGLEVLVLDQTRPEVGCPVVRVIVPGLRHFRTSGFAPGRLYDVPVRMGWRTAPAAEAALNPVTLWY